MFGVLISIRNELRNGWMALHQQTTRLDFGSIYSPPARLWWLIILKYR
jgi:hypothetical protein